MTETDDGLTDQGKLLFGAGFVFGVGVTLLLLGVVLVVVTSAEPPDRSLASSAVAALAGAIVFIAIVGGGLTYLAFPENRTRVAVDPALFGLDDEE